MIACAPSDQNESGAAFTVNVINSTEWGSMESSGAVFLPAAGSRLGTSYDSYNGIIGYYWAASHKDDYTAYGIEFYHIDAEYSVVNTESQVPRCAGSSVRLVHDAE